MAIDPVCKMKVDERSAKFKSEYRGKIYYFCAPGCKKAFDEDPEKYLHQEQKQWCCDYWLLELILTLFILRSREYNIFNN